MQMSFFSFSLSLLCGFIIVVFIMIVMIWVDKFERRLLQPLQSPQRTVTPFNPGVFFNQGSPRPL